MITHAGCGLAVAGVGRAAALDMAQNGDTRVDADGLLDLPGDIHRAAHALGHDDHEVSAAGEAGVLDALHHVLLEVQRLLRHQHGGRADGDAHIQRQETGVAAHDFHHRAALMGLHGIAQLVNAVDGGVAGGVKADGVVGAADVVVNGGGDPHDRDTQARQLQRAAEGAVASDGDDTVQPQHLAGVDRFQAALLAHKVLAAGGIKDGAAAGENVTDAGALELDKVTGDQALPAAANADALDAAVQRGTNHRAHSGVHARRVAPAGQHADPFDFFHVSSPCFHDVFYRFFGFSSLYSQPGARSRFHRSRSGKRRLFRSSRITSRNPDTRLSWR